MDYQKNEHDETERDPVLKNSVKPDGHEADQGGWKTFVFDFIKVLIVAVAIIFPIRFYLFQPFIVKGESMLPNFEEGDYLIIDEISYKLRDVHRGEVVVLHPPSDPSQFFIKRVIGLPNERVVIKDGHVTIYNSDQPKGLSLEEDYLNPRTSTLGTIDTVLGSDQYFVMGDNRLASSDSRLWGPIHQNNIIGRVYLRALPLGKLDHFSAPDYTKGQ